MRFIFCLIGLLLNAQALGATIQEKTLDNGLKVIVKEDHRAPIYVLQMWYHVGSSYEPQGLTGVSHALEHMMFKGSADQAPGEFARTVARLGGSTNAFTSTDFTAYYQMLNREHLKLSLELEADRMQNLLLSEEEFAKEIKVIMEERRLRTEDNPSGQLRERFNSIAYTSSYGQPIIGWMNDLQQLSIEDVRQWYQQWYVPNNATLVIVGDVDAEEVFSLVDDYFSNIPEKALVGNKRITDISNLGRRDLSVSLHTDVPTLLMAFNVPGLRTAQASWQPYALMVLTAILDGGRSGRFPTEFIRKQQTLAGVSVNYNPFGRGDDLVLISATPNTQRNITLAGIEKIIRSELEKIKRSPPTQAELSRIKNQLIADMVFTQDSISEQANMLGSLESAGLSWKLLDELIQRVSEITPEQVQKAASLFLNEDRLTVAHLIPDSAHSNDSSPYPTTNAHYEN